MAEPMRPRKYQFFLIIGLTCLASAMPAKAQIRLDVFVDPHPTVSGGTIGFAFAGNKFVGSVDHDGTGVLYQTDLDGRNLRLFAPSVNIPGGSVDHEHILVSSLGLGGFPRHDIYVAGGTSILHISNDGKRSQVFASFGMPVRAMTFDGVGMFNYDLLVATYSGDIYKVNHLGVVYFLASVGEDVEGMQVAPLNARFGYYDGQLILIGVASGLIRAIGPRGSLATLNLTAPIPYPESLYFVPMDLGATGNHLEGLYSASWPLNVLKAGPEEFADFKGDAIVMSEVGDHRISRVHWNGAKFEITVIGYFPNQAEDGFFVGPETLSPGGSCPAQENTGNQEQNEWCWPNCEKSHPRRPKRDTPEAEERRKPSGIR
jgi:hypothetical protein